MLLADIILNKHRMFARESYLYELVKVMDAKKNTETVSFYDAIKNKGLSIIGEIRKASPELGLVNKSFDLEKMVEDFSVEADAISVHTEQHYYAGRDKDIESVHAITKKPILMRDFVISPLQIFSAKKLGASAVILVSEILNDTELKEYFKLIKGLHMDAVIQVHNKASLERAIQFGFKIISISTINYETREENLAVIADLSVLVPPHMLVLAECHRYDDYAIELVHKANVDGIFVSVDLFGRKDIVSRLKDIRCRHNCFAMA